MNQGLNKRGNTALHINVGARVTETNGYFETDAEIITHAVKGTHAFSSLLIYRYFRLGRSHPFIGFGADINLLVKETSSIANFRRIEAGYNLNAEGLDFFNAIYLSPLLHLGAEIPLKKRHFLLIGSSAGLAIDADNKRPFLLEFSVGLNLL